MSIFILVACSGPKLSHKAPAESLYQSTLFKLSAEWARARSPNWAILSAKYGLLSPRTVISPYDFKLDAHSVKEWAPKVREQICSRWGSDTVIVVLAGSLYLQCCNDLPNKIVTPLEGLSIGQRMQWLKQDINTRRYKIPVY